MRKSADGLKRLEAESKRFLNVERESAIEEFRQYVFEEIFRKKLGYDCLLSMNWDVEQQVYIINDKLKIKITLDEVNERSVLNRLFRDYAKGGNKR